jgi:glycosyltransferase involved in cell wall biosynthesis
VSTRHAGIPEAVQEGVTGYLVDEGDTAAMAAHLVHLAAHPDERQAMGRAGWKRARAEFSWDRERARLIEILQLGHRL